MANLNEKVALVTGGGRGLGRGIAQALAEAGAQVMVSDLNPASAEETASLLQNAGFAARSVRADVTSEASLQAMIEAALTYYKRIDILVNNAGAVSLNPVLDINMKEWDLTFDVNVKGLFLTSQMVARLMIEQRTGGNIVNIASNAGKVGFASQAHYNASKAAVINLTRSMAMELAPHHINVNAVCPGAVDTPMLLQCAEWLTRDTDNDPHALMRSFAPPQLGRLIQPIEVGRIVAFLASDAAAIIRGQSINVDAGATPY